jgi:hypothetical protein
MNKFSSNVSLFLTKEKTKTLSYYYCQQVYK